MAATEDVLRVNEALDVLAQAEPRLAQVVEMRYFGGYTEAEIAEALELTERTVRPRLGQGPSAARCHAEGLTVKGCDVRFRSIVIVWGSRNGRSTGTPCR